MKIYLSAISKRSLLCIALVLAGGCGQSNQTTLIASGIKVVLGHDPYVLSVRNHRDREVLRSIDAEFAADNERDGWAPFAWTSGEFRWRPGVITKGHYLFDPNFDPWREVWRFERAERSIDGTQVTLIYRPGDERMPPDARAAITHTVRDGVLRVEATLSGVTPRAWSFAFASPVSEGFLGLGERFTRTNFRGLSIYSWAEEGGVGEGEGTGPGPENPWPNGESMTYFPVPFFLSTQGYGFWIDSTWRNQFDFATDYETAWRFWDSGPTTSFEVVLPGPPMAATAAAPGAAGDALSWPYRIIERFTLAVGRHPLPADWVLGPRRRIGRNSMALGIGEIEAMRQQDLALTAVDDSLHFLPRANHIGIEDELRAWVSRAHDLGLKVLGYYNSLYSLDAENPIRDLVDEGVNQGYFLKNPDGTPSQVELISGELLPVLQVDFTHPEATAWHQSHYDWALQLGYDGWMQDFGEYVQPDAVAFNGMTGEQYHNLYPVQYHKAVFEKMEAERPHDWLAFVRAGYTGSWRYATAIWSGDPAASFEDTDGLPSMIRAGVNLGIVGAALWGGDIGGFHCTIDGGAAADGELIARWIQQGALSPIMMDQNACALAPDGEAKASIWDSDAAFVSWKTYARLHTRLFPYLRALVQQAHERGTPIMRHMFLEHPERPDWAGMDKQYYFGPAILVAPVVERGARNKDLVLPAGTWLEVGPWWAPHATTVTTFVAQDPVLHRAYAHESITVAAPLTYLPLFLRAGQIVPMLDETIDTLAPEDHTEVVGPDDVSGWYDVWAALVEGDAREGVAELTLADGGVLRAELTGDFSSSALVGASNNLSCVHSRGEDTCWLHKIADAGCNTNPCPDGVPEGAASTILISHPGGTLEAGGLKLHADVGRRVNWTIVVVEP